MAEMGKLPSQTLLFLAYFLHPLGIILSQVGIQLGPGIDYVA